MYLFKIMKIMSKNNTQFNILNSILNFNILINLKKLIYNRYNYNIYINGDKNVF